jgi:hypothetical protein
MFLEKTQKHCGYNRLQIWRRGGERKKYLYKRNFMSVELVMMMFNSSYKL